MTKLYVFHMEIAKSIPFSIFVSSCLTFFTCVSTHDCQQSSWHYCTRTITVTFNTEKDVWSSFLWLTLTGHYVDGRCFSCSRWNDLHVVVCFHTGGMAERTGPKPALVMCNLSFTLSGLARSRICLHIWDDSWVVLMEVRECADAYMRHAISFQCSVRNVMHCMRVLWHET